MLSEDRNLKFVKDSSVDTSLRYGFPKFEIFAQVNKIRKEKSCN